MTKTEQKRIERIKKLKEYDASYNAKNLCGMDEAGRGCMAGPIYAAAVILNKNEEISDLNDSKKIKEEKRYEILEEIKEKALAYGIGIVSNEEIDEMGIQKANFEAFKRAYDEMVKNYKIEPDKVLIDGNYKGIEIDNHEMVVKGDTQSAAIAAASILAKASRDKYVIDVCDVEYPDYNFKKHKGYGTKEHRDAIELKGICEYHRKSFCKNYM